MGTIISVANRKGGVGKTTTVYNLSAALAHSGKNVLMIDWDPQTDLTKVAGYDPLSFDVTLSDVLQEKKKPIPLSQAIYKVEDIPGLSMVPVTEELAVIEVDLYNDQRTRLKDVVEPVKPYYDYIIIDCPPQLSTLTVNALAASDYVIMACETAELSFSGVGALMQTIDEVRKHLNPELKIYGTIATIYNTVEKTDKEILSALQDPQYRLLGVIKKAAAIKRGLKAGLPAVINQPWEDAAKEYIRIAEEIKNSI